jgi:lipopolysaccharide/colanic/teichoic acid biosynthesis glycosyltransferase
MSRRLIDLLVAGVALLALTPVLVGVALCIWWLDGRPIFFVQRRAGWRATPFPMIKFRTMRPHAEQTGGTLTFRQDPRITPLGRFLRRGKLDELPQLLNVLRGEMTLIGPRPEVLDWAEGYSPAQREVFDFKPGLTDPVQLHFRHEQEFLSSAAEYRGLSVLKVQQQIQYLRSRTVFTDFIVLCRTVRALFPSQPSGAELATYASLRASAAAESSPFDSARRSNMTEDSQRRAEADGPPSPARARSDDPQPSA